MSEMHERGGYSGKDGDHGRRSVVITGASSGIGRAAALEFARRGANLALTARSAHSLTEVAESCRQMGVEVLDVPADVTEAQALEELAQRVRETFGAVDVWVNDAAVTLFGRFEEVPYEDLRRVIDTNLFGYINGARAVLPVFREQGYGVLVNVSSMTGRIGQPYTSAYTAAKFAVNGLSESLRMELRDAPDIHVCTVLAGSVDTPLFQHGGNYSGRAVQPMPPVEDVERAARRIADLADHPRREITIGGSGRALRLARATVPTLMERVMARKVERQHFRSSSAPESDGNLFHPVDVQNSMSGGWRTGQEGRNGMWTAALVVGLAGAGIGAAAWGLTRGSPACRECAQEERQRERQRRERLRAKCR